MAMRAVFDEYPAPWNFTVVTGEPLNQSAPATARGCWRACRIAQFRAGEAFAGAYNVEIIAKQLFVAR